MRTNILALCAVAWMAWAPQAFASLPDETSPATQADVDKVRAELREAVTVAQATPFDAAKVGDLMKAIVAEPGFASLSGDERHAAYLLLGLGELGSGDDSGALAALTTAIQMPAAGGDDWSVRLDAAYRAHDDAAAAESLAMLAQRWPDKLADHDDVVILHTANVADTRDGRARESALLESLHASKWHPTDPFWSADALWLRLVRIRLENGDRAGAAAVMDEITDSGAYIDVHADKRFDAMTAADPSKYDVAAAQARDLAALRSKAAAAPDRLEGINTLALELAQFNRAQEALALLDGALARMADGKTAFADQNDQINWTMDDRARVLDDLGRFDEALAQRIPSAKLQEDGTANVSQAINLADDYDALERPGDALAALRDLGGTSLYGSMAMQEARACAYAQLGDAANLRGSMDYLKAHAADGPQPLLNARLCAGDLDGAAGQVIAALADPSNRMDMLYRLQDFAVPPLAPHDAKMHDAWIALRGRADVQAAIAKVGRIASYRVLAQ